MKILITGSSGFIGSELVKYLTTEHDIVTYDLANGEDISDFEKLKDKMKGSEAVVHLAALRKPYEDKSFEDYFRINCKGTLSVAKAAAENGVKKFIYTSSTSYYGLEQGIPFPKELSEKTETLTQRVKVSELECRDCDIAYSTSKVIAEQVLANYGMSKKMQVIILRIGPTRKDEYRPFGDLELHLKIENCLQAIELSINNKDIWFDAFNILDENKKINQSKARKILGFDPK